MIGRFEVRVHQYLRRCLRTLTERLSFRCVNYLDKGDYQSHSEFCADSSGTALGHMMARMS